MTPEQFLIVIGIIYIAPHLDEKFGLMAGVVLISVATVVGLGSQLIKF